MVLTGDREKMTREYGGMVKKGQYNKQPGHRIPSATMPLPRKADLREPTEADTVLMCYCRHSEMVHDGRCLSPGCGCQVEEL